MLDPQPTRAPALDAATASAPIPRDPRCPFDPPRELVQEQRAGGLTRLPQSDGSVRWLVTRHEFVRSLLRDPRLSSNPATPGFPNAPGVPAPPPSAEPDGLYIQKDPPEHSRLRKMTTGPLTIKSVRAMQPEIQQTVDGLIDDLLAGPDPTDFITAFALPLPSIIICQLLGAPYAERDVFQSTAQVLIDPSTTHDEKMGARLSLSAYLADLLQRKGTEPGDDLYSQLYAEQVATGEISAQEAVGMGLMLLIAGHETTASTLGLGVTTLLSEPEVRRDLQANLDDEVRVNNFVEEVLRYQTIVREPLRRAALADIPVGDEVIRRGDGVLFALDVANRDPEVFDDPDAFDPTRNARQHVGFGFGVHQCVGQQLARMELSVAFTTLLRRIPTLELAVPFDDLRFKLDTLIYGVEELPVRVRPIDDSTGPRA